MFASRAASAAASGATSAAMSGATMGSSSDRFFMPTTSQVSPGFQTQEFGTTRSVYVSQIQDAIRKKESHLTKRLYGLELPLSGLTGALVYILALQATPKNKLIDDFMDFYESTVQVRRQINRVNDQVLAQGIALKPDFKTAMGRLKLAMQGGQKISTIQSLIGDLMRYDTGVGGTEQLLAAARQYRYAYGNILSNRKGLEAFAKEPLVVKTLSGLPENEAKRLLSQDPQKFVATICQNLMRIEKPEQLEIVLSRVGGAQKRLARLLGVMTAIGLGGFFTVRHAMSRMKLHRANPAT